MREVVVQCTHPCGGRASTLTSAIAGSTFHAAHACRWLGVRACWGILLVGALVRVAEASECRKEGIEHYVQVRCLMNPLVAEVTGVDATEYIRKNRRAFRVDGVASSCAKKLAKAFVGPALREAASSAQGHIDFLNAYLGKLGIRERISTGDVAHEAKIATYLARALPRVASGEVSRLDEDCPRDACVIFHLLSQEPWNRAVLNAAKEEMKPLLLVLCAKYAAMAAGALAHR